MIKQSLLAIAVLCSLSACGRRDDSKVETRHAAGSPSVALTTSTQDLMRHLIEPSAEAPWESVSTSVSAEGVEEKHPRMDEEWFAVRSHAVTLMEAANLLGVPGRKVIAQGQAMADEGVQGVISAAEVQTKMDSQHGQFKQFAQLLHSVSADMLKAIDTRSVQGTLDAGEAIDSACESCHMAFWYPNQVIPELAN